MQSGAVGSNTAHAKTKHCRSSGGGSTQSKSSRISGCACCGPPLLPDLHPFAGRNRCSNLTRRNPSCNRL
eukprot:5903357-Lingulodinium_polyedra.AAC.1